MVYEDELADELEMLSTRDLSVVAVQFLSPDDTATLGIELVWTGDAAAKPLEVAVSVDDIGVQGFGLPLDQVDADPSNNTTALIFAP